MNLLLGKYTNKFAKLYRWWQKICFPEPMFLVISNLEFFLNLHVLFQKKRSGEANAETSEWKLGLLKTSTMISIETLNDQTFIGCVKHSCLDWENGLWLFLISNIDVAIKNKLQIRDSSKTAERDSCKTGEKEGLLKCKRIRIIGEKERQAGKK